MRKGDLVVAVVVQGDASYKLQRYELCSDLNAKGANARRLSDGKLRVIAANQFGVNVFPAPAEGDSLACSLIAQAVHQRHFKEMENAIRSARKLGAMPALMMDYIKRQEANLAKLMNMDVSYALD